MTGRRRPASETAARLGLALGVDLPLSDQDKQLAWTATQPSCPAPGTSDHLSVILAGLRRLEDATGAAPVLPPVLAHVGLIASLADEVPDPDRLAVVDQLGQWT